MHIWARNSQFSLNKMKITHTRNGLTHMDLVVSRYGTCYLFVCTLIILHLCTVGPKFNVASACAEPFPLPLFLMQGNALQIEELLDKLSVSLTGEELEIIGKLYQQAMRLEVEFFSAQPVDQPVVAPLSRYCDPKYKLLIFSDFDLTCTIVDSSAILAEIAILSHQKASQGGPDNPVDCTKSADLRSSWNTLSKQYMEEYEQCMERLLPLEEGKSITVFNFLLSVIYPSTAYIYLLMIYGTLRLIPARTLDYNELYKGMEVLAEFEKQANSRVVDSGVLRGMNLEDIRKAGERPILQDGCKNFFQKIGKSRENLNLDIHILSYCWCGELIRSAFSSGKAKKKNLN
jgi:thiamine phosphate phosphatase / amino-HMP aminohydrolase